jgi:hypothetical protein
MEISAGTPILRFGNTPAAKFISMNTAGAFSVTGDWNVSGTITATSSLSFPGLKLGDGATNATTGQLLLRRYSGSPTFITFTEDQFEVSVANFAIGSQASGGDFTIYRSPSSETVFSGTQALRIVKSSGNLIVGTHTTASARLHITSTTEQFREGYDTSNYWSHTIGSTGALTMQGVGTGGALTLSPTSGQNLNISLATTGDLVVNTNQLYVDTSASAVGFGTTTPSAKVHILKTTEQLRLGYDATNYFSTTVGSTGSTTFALTGTSPEFTFSQAVNVPDEAYGSGWNTNLEVPTKNAIYDALVPYTGATGDVTLGSWGLTAGNLTCSVITVDGQAISLASAGVLQIGSIAFNMGAVTMVRTYLPPDADGSLALMDNTGFGTFTADDITTPLLNSTGVVRLMGYTVATLPAGTQGDTAYCTDLTTPTYMAVAVGGGAVVGPVFFDGTNWVSY